MSVQSMTTLSKILVPTDFSSNSSSAINYACDLAQDANSELHLLYVSQGSLSDLAREKQLQRLAHLLDARTELNLNTVKYVSTGRPDRGIVEYAREHGIDLVVMGTHGRTGLAHLALGSVAENVVRLAPCPVVVLGPRDAMHTTSEDAVRVVQRIVGKGLDASIEEGRKRMLKSLVEELRVPSTSAILLFEELQENEQLVWHDGRWTIKETGTLVGPELVSFHAEALPESHAIDLIARAVKLRATDIHIDPISDDETLIRMRVDGCLQEYCHMNRGLADHLCNQMKTMANLSTTDPFHPLEGRMRLPDQLADVEVRLTSVPVNEGQALALRLFDPQKVFLELDNLGLSQESLQAVETILKSGEGLVLVTGPTGSGKTTTVYSMLRSLDGKRHNITSIEDPVEFAAPFVRQISVDERHGLDMTEGLRTMLRMDPDILFIGEIRDAKTAMIGMQAAGSGRYVFSTLHTRDVPSTVTALRQLGVSERSIASHLTGVVNQRIVRRLCTQCKQGESPHDMQREECSNAGILVPDKLFKPVGCSSCNGSGYRGRIGIFEVATINAELKQLILEQRSDREMAELMRNQACADLQTDALRKAAEGLISFEDAIMIRWVG